MSQPKPIKGRDNPEFKRFLAARARKDRDLILVEGPKLLGEAIRSGLLVRHIAVGDSVDRVPMEWGHATVVRFSDSLLKSLVDVETHQGVVAIVERPRPATHWLEEEKVFVLILDGVQDPGNVGTLFRTAEAAGVSGLLLTRGCADPMSPKVLRASAGSVFRVPHVSDLGIHDLKALVPDRVKVVAALARPGSLSAFEAPLDLPIALALGSEGSGLSPEVEAAAAICIRIPQARDVESLNVAIAGAICMFEIAARAGLLRN